MVLLGMKPAPGDHESSLKLFLSKLFLARCPSAIICTLIGFNFLIVLIISLLNSARTVNSKSILFCTTTDYFYPFFSSLLKKDGRRKGEWSSKAGFKVLNSKLFYLIHFCKRYWHFSPFDNICIIFDFWKTFRPLLPFFIDSHFSKNTVEKLNKVSFIWRILWRFYKK